MIHAYQVHDIMSSHTIGDGEPIVIDHRKSSGVYLVDAVTGTPYLDCSSQFASMAIGWNHPKMEIHAGKLGTIGIHKYANSDFYSSELAEFVDKFAWEIAPDFNHFFFIEGGALGVENALKAAFDWKARKLRWNENQVNQLDVIHLKQAFHGRSGYTLSLTNTIPNKTDLFPKFNWTRIKNPKIKFPMVESEVIADEEFSLCQAELALKTNQVAAIILEPIQSEGGDNHFTPRYLAALRKLADQYETMLIFDEVQTGIGLTGKMWAYEHFGIIPDMITFGKKTQVCGFASTTRIDDMPENVFHTFSRINSTFGGNIVDMIRFTAIAGIITEDRLVENSAIVGEYFLEQLKTVPRITNVRGRGLMLAFDLEDGDKRNKVLDNLRKKMTILPCGEKSIRLRPHLIFNKNNVDEAISYIRHAISY